MTLGELSRGMKRNWAMSDDEEEIRLIEFYKRIKTRRVMSRGEISVEEEKNSSPILIKEDADEMKKPLHVCQYAFKHFRRYKDGHESEEEVVGDDQHNEHKWGYKFILNPNKLTYTGLKFPIKLYFKSSVAKVLHDPKYPVSTLTKLALQRYNEIEGTNYHYVGLVKAYKTAVAGFHYTVRFQAYLPGQPPIYFQSMLAQGLPDRRSKTVL